MGTRTKHQRKKRANENDLQWRSRLAREDESRRKKDEPIITPETQQKGGYGTQFVTAEDGTKVQTHKRQTVSSLKRLEERGVINSVQLVAAQEIAMVAEGIERNVAVRGASLSARVDCQGSGFDQHSETLARIRREQAYSAWRLRLPLPRRMVLDMVVEDRQLAAVARRHNRSWPKAIKVLRACLDMWEEEKRKAFDRIGQEDADRANAA